MTTKPPPAAPPVSPNAASTSSAPTGSSGDANAALLSAVAEGLSNRQLLAWMFRFVKPVRGLVFWACFWLALWVAVEVLTTRQAGQAVNHIQRQMHEGRAVPETARHGFIAWLRSGDPDARTLSHLVLGLVVLVIAYAVLRYLREVAASKMSMNMVFYIREAVYDKLQRAGFGFHDALSSGQLINRALSDLQNCRQFVQSAIILTFEIVLVVLFNIALIITLSPWIALLSLVPLPIWTWYILRFSKVVQPAAKAVMEAEDKNISIITENIAGVHVVKAFATEKHEIEKYGANCDDFKGRVLKRIRLYTNFQPIIRLIATASHLSLFTAAALMAIRGKLAAGDFLILGAAMGNILARLQSVATINENYQNAIVSARRLYEVLMAPASVAEKPDARPLPKGAGEVVFENVTFGYSEPKPVLHDVSFRVKGGGVVAIVGPTGAGKTTLVNLIARFYDPQHGRITLDGIDVRDVSLASLRSQVTFVFQETYLFSDTAAANIAYGRPGISAGEVEAAARLAQAHEFIETMPKGYDSVLRERGADLSGGQKQRLAIARAIVTNPRVLILDDATAAIDPETEDLIRRGMGFVMRGRTTFVIAHRISTVKRADLVVVLEHGRVTQIGTHDALMEQEGHYREIAVAQLYGDEEEDEKVKSSSPSHMRRVQGKDVVELEAETVGRTDASEPMGK